MLTSDLVEDTEIPLCVTVDSLVSCHAVAPVHHTICSLLCPVEACPSILAGSGAAGLDLELLAILSFVLVLAIASVVSWLHSLLTFSSVLTWHLRAFILILIAEKSGPSVLTITSVVENLVDAQAILAFVYQAFINIVFTGGSIKTRSAGAFKVVGRIATASAILAFMLVAKDALPFNQILLIIHDKLVGCRAVELTLGEEGKQDISNPHLSKAAPEKVLVGLVGEAGTNYDFRVLNKGKINF